jgi:hypothetical protein
LVPERGNRTWHCRFVRFQLGLTPTGDQFVESRVVFCCSTKSVDGIVHESAAPAFETVRLSVGVGVTWETTTKYM